MGNDSQDERRNDFGDAVLTRSCNNHVPNTQSPGCLPQTYFPRQHQDQFAKWIPSYMEHLGPVSSSLARYCVCIVLHPALPAYEHGGQ